MIRRHFVGLMAPVLVMGILIFCGLGTAALAEELNIANGDIHITETGYRQGQSQQIAYTGPYTVTSTGSGAIVVESGAHDITISNLQITASGTPAIQVDAGATLRLTVEGENRLTGGSGFAGICVAPAYDAQWHYDADASGKLYLSGDGTLGAMGGAYGGGAGIGGNGEDQRGGDSVDFGLVCVTENFTGILDATGGAASVYKDGENAFGGGAGIGSGGFNMGLIDNYTKPGLYY